MAATLGLWCHLFGRSQTRVGPSAAPGSPQESWPRALGPRPDSAAFAWLDALPGACWLADASAREILSASGAAPPAPPLAAVETTHDKAFAAGFASASGYEPPCLSDLIHSYSPGELAEADAWLADLRARLATWPNWTRGRFTLKPRLGSSGRGRVGGRADALEPKKLRAALPRLARQGGALLEPWLQRTTDLSVMLHIAPPAPQGGGEITLLGAAEQLVAPSGVYAGHLGEVDSRWRVFSGGPFEEAMREAAGAIAARAQQAGYWGPCGIDGFAFNGPEITDTGSSAPAAPLLRPLVEFNARFTVGIVVAGLLRRAANPAGPALGLQPGERRGFLFALDPPGDWSDWASLAEATGPGSLLFPLHDPTDREAPGGEAEGSAARPALLFAANAGTLRDALARPAGPGA